MRGRPAQCVEGAPGGGHAASAEAAAEAEAAVHMAIAQVRRPPSTLNLVAPCLLMLPAASLCFSFRQGSGGERRGP